MKRQVSRMNRHSLAAMLLGLALVILFSVGPVQAAAPAAPPGPGGSLQPLVDLVTAVARLFIQFFVFSSVAVFAVSVARGFWSAQIANLVGSPMGVSQAWLNIIAAVFIFVLAVMSTTFVSIVFDAVKGYVDTSIPLPHF